MTSLSNRKSLQCRLSCQHWYRNLVYTLEDCQGESLWLWAKKLKRLQWRLCTMEPGSLGLLCIFQHVSCKCPWMWTNSLSCLSCYLVRIFYFTRCCARVFQTWQDTISSCRSLLPCSMPDWLNIMAALKALLHLSFHCFLMTADTAKERCEGLKVQ